ncbi:hypothetical protein GGU11DRAFT_857459 [Lentinula aff. detonsa]|nr:hypothetical protein GGU11DRAFT_857459 [Lentinula aff. detonsa]
MAYRSTSNRTGSHFGGGPSNGALKARVVSLVEPPILQLTAIVEPLLLNLTIIHPTTHQMSKKPPSTMGTPKTKPKLITNPYIRELLDNKSAKEARKWMQKKEPTKKEKEDFHKAIKDNEELIQKKWGGGRQDYLLLRNVYQDEIGAAENSITLTQEQLDELTQPVDEDGNMIEDTEEETEKPKRKRKRKSRKSSPIEDEDMDMTEESIADLLINANIDDEENEATVPTPSETTSKTPFSLVRLTTTAHPIIEREESPAVELKSRSPWTEMPALQPIWPPLPTTCERKVSEVETLVRSFDSPILVTGINYGGNTNSIEHHQKAIRHILELEEGELLFAKAVSNKGRSPWFIFSMPSERARRRVLNVGAIMFTKKGNPRGLSFFRELLGVERIQLKNVIGVHPDDETFVQQAATTRWPEATITVHRTIGGTSPTYLSDKLIIKATFIADQPAVQFLMDKAPLLAPTKSRQHKTALGHREEACTYESWRWPLKGHHGPPSSGPAKGGRGGYKGKGRAM